MGRHKKIAPENEKNIESEPIIDNTKENITELTPLIEMQKEAEEGEKKSKYKEKKEKEKIKFQFIAKIPIIIINFLFLKLDVTELDTKEEKDLSMAFEGMLIIFPPKWLKYLEKLSPVVFFIYVVSIIVNKRRLELIEKKKKSDSNNFKDDDDIVKTFSDNKSSWNEND